MMRSQVLVFIAVVCFLCPLCGMAWAQDSTLAADKQEIKSEKQEMKENTQEARAEESRLRSEIAQAEVSGDMTKAAQLREQLRVMHAENVQQMHKDKRELKEAGQELRQDIKEAHKDKRLPRRLDRDDNPPGPRGGAGTNWENPPGPKGGPGASPDRR